MVRFPSAEWADELKKALGANVAYADAAKAWEGDILLLVLPEAGATKGSGVYLDLYHGACRAASFVPDSTAVKSEFVFEGTRENWGRVFRREIDPVGALLNGTFRIRGNLAKAMRFTQAARLLVETAAQIPAEV